MPDVHIHAPNTTVHVYHEPVQHLHLAPGTVMEQAGHAFRVSPSLPHQTALDLDELTAQLRRALGLRDRCSWEEAIQVVHARTDTAKSRLTGWGTIKRQGHTTYLGEVHTGLVGTVAMVYVTEPAVPGDASHEDLREEDHAFPLSMLYGFDPGSEEEVRKVRAMYRPGRATEAPTTYGRKPTPSPTDDPDAAKLHLELVLAGRELLSFAGVIACSPEQRAELRAWLGKGAPMDEAPQCYDEDVPF